MSSYSMAARGDKQKTGQVPFFEALKQVSDSLSA